MLCEGTFEAIKDTSRDGYQINNYLQQNKQHCFEQITIKNSNVVIM